MQLDKSPEDMSADSSLDPADWTEFRKLAHGMLDSIISHVEGIRSQPVWQPPSAEVLSYFSQPLPEAARDLHEVLDEVRTHVMPFATGNLHPGFMGWVHGAGTPVGLLGELVSAGLNMNCGGRNHVGIEVEQQVVRWMKNAFHYPDEASGVFVTGSSMANFLATIVAKSEALGSDSRELGLRQMSRDLVAYASSEAHSCVAQALELSGIGSVNLRKVPVDDSKRMRIDELKRAISADRASGNLPFLLVGTAGTVNTGAIDPLSELSRVAAQERIWFHVDGAIGALATFSPELKGLFSGIESSDSIALDFHKSGHVPYDAGFLLVKDGKAHKRAFANSAGYLQRSENGLAAGETWPCDLGVDLSRGCRALKTWITLSALGTQRIGRSIAHTCKLADYLGERISQSPQFILKSPVSLNIVCFGVRTGGDALIREIVTQLQLAGIAAPSWTSLNGETVVRCAIVNHRTTKDDIDRFLQATSDLVDAADLPENRSSFS
jgi:aromatic-L-amino-acid/L-tryptophan decarboxylase